MKKNAGKITQVISAIIDVQFDNDVQLPDILNALECDHHGKKLVMEVTEHIGDNTVRCVAMSSTDDLTKGLAVINTGKSAPLSFERGALGRIGNVETQHAHPACVGTQTTTFSYNLEGDINIKLDNRFKK